MSKIAKGVDILILIIISIITSIMIISTFLQVVFRYLFSNPLFWSEELARYCFIYIVFIGGAWAGKNLSHLGVDFFVSKFPQKTINFLDIFINTLVIIFSVLITVISIPVIKINMKQYSPALEVPMGLVYCAVPVGFMLTAFYYTLHLFNAIKAENQGV